jgi:hypothetical protein
MSLKFQEGMILYNSKLLVSWDDFDEARVYWDTVDFVINDIDISSLIKVTKEGLEYQSEKAEELLVKSYCLALMFAFNYGFRSHIDLESYSRVWEGYSIHVNNRDVDMFESEIIITDDIHSTEITCYEDSEVIQGRKYTLYSSVNWKSVFGFVHKFYETENDQDVEDEHLMALGLMQARDDGLKNGKLL